MTVPRPSVPQPGFAPQPGSAPPEGAAGVGPAGVVDQAAHHVDVLVVGSGIAGLTVALDVADHGARVLVATRSGIAEGSTGWAQGGLAAVSDDHPVPGDDLTLHVRDTIVAGAGLCDLDAVPVILAEAGVAVAALAARGAEFDADHRGRWLRTREGGHSASRVIHAGGDATGAEVSRALVEQAALRRLHVLEGQRAVALVRGASGRVTGADLAGPDGRLLRVNAKVVVLATGGAGQLYTRTTNPPGATGDGIALALRAGAAVSDVEFVQFHPTALWLPQRDGSQVPLVTEAVRGEGGILRDDTGRAFMAAVHPLRDLAPRDVVAAAIALRLQETGADHVWLDARSIHDFVARFPTVAQVCEGIGVDPGHDLIPVVPAAHYHCGGVFTDLDGRTTVPGLFAVGEVARTGLHGANRLASNSLVEGLVMGRRAARAALSDLALAAGADSTAMGAGSGGTATGAGGAGGARSSRMSGTDPAVLAAIQRAMTLHAGIGRDAAGLAEALDVLDAVGPAAGLVGLTARAVVTAASHREESRGCHRRWDHPEARPELARSTCWRLADPEREDTLEVCARQEVLHWVGVH